MFLLLPFRHSRTTKNLDFVMEKLSFYENNETFTMLESKLFNKFKLATLRDYSKVTDTINLHISNLEDCPSYDPIIHDDKCNYVKLLSKINDNDITSYPLYKSIEKFTIDNNIRGIAVSLSGGVDSNVLLYILYQMKLKSKLSHLIAIHLDYGNRNVSNIEAIYLMNLCKYLNIPIFIRRIDHMKRSDDLDRTFYEIESKNIRFGLYKYALSQYDSQINCVSLGHHKDDRKETVFMNLMRNKDLLDLFVMSPILVNDGVTIVRPMLENYKDDIYEIAHKYNIMYFKDTTPDESFRGTIRRKIFPSIQSFDQKMLDSLISIGQASNEWRNVIEKIAMEPILNTLKKGKNGFSITFPNKISDLPYVYWSRLFISLFHGQQIRMIKNKNLRMFVEWTQKLEANSGLFRLSNGYIVTYFNLKLYFFRMELFNINNNNPTNILLNESTKMISYINNWKIVIEITEEYIKNPMTYDDLINGIYVYTEPINEFGIFEIKYSLNKKDGTRKLFSKLGKLSEIIPKCSSGLVSMKGNTKYAKIYIINSD